MTASWPIVVLLCRRSEPIQEKIEGRFTHSINSMVEHSQLFDFVQFLAKKLLHCGQCTNIEGQRINPVQQWQQIGKHDAQILHVIGRSDAVKIEIHSRQYWSEMAQKIPNFCIKMTENDF